MYAYKFGKRDLSSDTQSRLIKSAIKCFGPLRTGDRTMAPRLNLFTHISVKITIGERAWVKGWGFSGSEPH